MVVLTRGFSTIWNSSHVDLTTLVSKSLLFPSGEHMDYLVREFKLDLVSNSS